MPLNNFGRVTIHTKGFPLYRAAQPDADGFNTARALGVGLVFKLNSESAFPLALESSLIPDANVEAVPQIAEPLGGRKFAAETIPNSGWLARNNASAPQTVMHLRSILAWYHSLSQQFRSASAGSI